MEQSNKELIKEIADLFEDYEESYVPGEWESFQQQKKKKYPFLPQWLKIAAVLLLIVSVLPYGVKKMMEKGNGDRSAAKQQTIAVTKPVQQAPAVDGAGGLKPLNGNTNDVKPADLKTAALRPTDAGASSATPVPSGWREEAVSQQLQSAALKKEQVVVPAENKAIASAAVANQILAENQVYTQKTAQAQNQVLAQNNAPAQTGVKPAASSRPVQPLTDSLAIPSKAKLSTAEFLLAESKSAAKKEKKKTALSKWDFGLQVMPTATRTNMNLGGGVVTAYHISDKLSLSSGISLVQLGSGENVPEPAQSMAVDAASFSAGNNTARGSRQLLSVDANIKAIDIPLGLVYKVNKHYYTSAGISYFNVLSEKRNNTYAEITPVSRISTDPATGATQAYIALESQEVDEVASEKPLKGNGYLGFFNFSVGRRQNIFKQYNIQIEPFIKVPIGKLSAQDLNLMNSGVKFQLSF